jgi:hypothetical protein
MKVITREQLAREAPKRWGEQYAYAIRTRERSTVDKAQIYDALCALTPEELTPERVDSVIGNGSWTSVTCNECDVSVDSVVQLGEEPDYESRTATVCPSCLARAVGLLLTGVTP